MKALRKFFNLTKKHKRGREVDFSIAGTYIVTNEFDDGVGNKFYRGDKFEVEYKDTRLEDPKFSHIAVYHMADGQEHINIEIYNVDGFYKNTKKIKEYQ